MRTVGKIIVIGLALAGGPVSAQSMVDIGRGPVGISAYGYPCVLLQDVYDKPPVVDSWLEDDRMCKIAVHDCLGNVVGYRQGRC